jgi:head-tail adaptor
VRDRTRRQRVTLQVVSELVDSVGQPLSTWTSVGTYYARVRGLKGSELTLLGQTVSILERAVETRKLPVEVRPEKHRFLFGTEVLNVQSSIDVNEDGQNYIHYCSSIVGEGV